jgi:hypothetical protein
MPSVVKKNENPREREKERKKEREGIGRDRDRDRNRARARERERERERMPKLYQYLCNTSIIQVSVLCQNVYKAFTHKSNKRDYSH